MDGWMGGGEVNMVNQRHEWNKIKLTSPRLFLSYCFKQIEEININRFKKKSCAPISVIEWRFEGALGAE
jgi:hypothetical protein